MPPVTVISAYQVCTTPTNTIGNTAWHQQKRALITQGRDIHPRKAFIDDLITVIKTFQEKHHDIILGGDFNETTDDPSSGVLRLVTAVNLTDPWAHRFPNQHQFKTQRYGSKRIDAVFVSHRLVPAINALGYAPFDYIMDSDHRAAIISFNTKKLFGDDADLMAPSQFRGVRTPDKKSTTIFIEKLYDHLQQNNAFELTKRLDDDSGPSMLVETLDNLVGQGGDSADKACRRRRPEFYSQRLVKQRALVGAYKSLINGLRHGVNRHSTVSARLARKEIQLDCPTTITAAITKYKEAVASLREVQKDHMTHRRTELSTNLKSAPTPNQSKAIEAISKAERNRATYKTLEAIKNKNGTTQKLDRLEVPTSWPPPNTTITTDLHLEDPKSCTDWTMITDPQDIEYYLLLRNRLHFGQAQGTPFTIQPLGDDLDWGASTPMADAILAGQYTTTINTPHCTTLLQACKAVANLDTIPAEMTYNEFKGKIQKWRETTSTSPSGRHLGRYRALFARSSYDPVTHDKPPLSHSQKLQQFWFKTVMRLLHFSGMCTGFSL